MSKSKTPSATKSTDASYKKSIAVILATLLMLLVASLLFNQVYRHNVVARALMQGSHDKDDPVSETNPGFVDLGTFAAHISGEDGEQSLRTSISLKLISPGLEERIKASIPEIQHHVNMVLQSKRASDLVSYEDKEKLALQIKEHVEYVMGLRKTAPIIGSAEQDAASSAQKGISDVLFTSFIIQY